MLAAVEERFGRKDSPLWYDMLSSGHVPFNLFVPLRGKPWSRKLLGSWLGRSVAEVTKLVVEWAPKPKSGYLDDNTSFDTYVECLLDDGRRASLGIEVKYTEGAYSWGKNERPRMFDESSLYHQVHRRAGLYVNDALDALRTRKLKQLWRNQLLGESLLQKTDLGIDVFTSVLVYPSRNTHYARAARQHSELIKPSKRRPFVAVTFEQFIGESRELANAEKAALAWLDYVERRYVIPT